MGITILHFSWYSLIFVDMCVVFVRRLVIHTVKLELNPQQKKKQNEENMATAITAVRKT